MIVSGWEFQTPKGVVEKHRLAEAFLALHAPNIESHVFRRPHFLRRTFPSKPNVPNLNRAQWEGRSGSKFQMTAQEKILVEEFVNYREFGGSAPLSQMHAQLLTAGNFCLGHFAH